MFGLLLLVSVNLTCFTLCRVVLVGDVALFRSSVQRRIRGYTLQTRVTGRRGFVFQLDQGGISSMLRASGGRCGLGRRRRQVDEPVSDSMIHLRRVMNKFVRYEVPVEEGRIAEMEEE